MKDKILDFLLKPTFIMALILFLLLLVLVLEIAEAGSHVEVSWVIDGDTLIVQYEGESRRQKVRLYGIDAPEIDQPCGKKAKHHLEKLVKDKVLHMEVINIGFYNRPIVMLKDHKTSININEAMVSDGYALVYNRYCKRPMCSRWRYLERNAKKKCFSMWMDDEHNIPPWEWRKRKKTNVK